MTNIDIEAINSAVNTAQALDVPIDDKTARGAAEAIKLALWRGSREIPGALLDFVQTGQYNRGLFDTDLYALAGTISGADNFIAALRRYLDYHANSAGKRGPVEGWPTQS